MSEETSQSQRDENEESHNDPGHDEVVQDTNETTETERCDGSDGGGANAAAAESKADATVDDVAVGEEPESAAEAVAETTATGDDGEVEDLAEMEVDFAELDPRDAEIAQLKDDLAHAQADFLNLQNEYGKYVRRAKAEAPVLRGYGHAEVAEAMISVLDDIQAAREHGDLQDGPFAAIANKLETMLESKFKFVRFGAVGEEFDPHQHEALMAQTTADVDVATVGQVLQPGYRIGERVLRAAKVLVKNPE